MSLIEALQWRYATKKYDAGRKISDADAKTLKMAIRLSPSSMGLQPYQVLVVTDPEVRARLAEFSFTNRDSILNASHLFVFATPVALNDATVADYMQRISKVRGIAVEHLSDFSGKLKAYVSGKSEAELQDWTGRQAYLALSNLISAAAELHLDATPMEGFLPAKYDEVLGLKELGLASRVIAVVGYRDASDATQHQPKVRKTEEELFINI